MNSQQLVAYRNPCFEAEDTVKAHFHWGVLGAGARMVSLHLTANVGLE